ncbi:MAG TPA: DNA-directed RNA polymerase subunit omega [Rubrobacteraceae bacterium]|nr:DNA-directed RNA polymerase subunit omega [Rubrobacteraceae bacterium]
MLNELKIDELLGKVDSRYGLVVSSAKRARQINEYTATLGLNDALGIPGPQVHTRSQHPLSIAIEELRQDKLEVTFREPADEVEEQVGAADGEGFVDPPSGENAPTADEVDTGAPEDEGDQGAA